MKLPKVMVVHPCEECGALAPVDDLCGAQLSEPTDDELIAELERRGVKL